MEYDNLKLESEDFGRKAKDEIKLKTNRLMEGEGKLELKRLL